MLPKTRTAPTILPFVIRQSNNAYAHTKTHTRHRYPNTQTNTHILALSNSNSNLLGRRQQPLRQLPWVTDNSPAGGRVHNDGGLHPVVRWRPSLVPLLAVYLQLFREAAGVGCDRLPPLLRGALALCWLIVFGVE